MANELLDVAYGYNNKCFSDDHRMFTAAQRHKIYKELLLNVCYDPSTYHGMCFYLKTHIKCLPELHKHCFNKDGVGYTYYYSKTGFYAPTTKKGWNKRIEWIEAAIKSTAPKKATKEI